MPGSILPGIFYKKDFFKLVIFSYPDLLFTSDLIRCYNNLTFFKLIDQTDDFDMDIN